VLESHSGALRGSDEGSLTIGPVGPLSWPVHIPKPNSFPVPQRNCHSADADALDNRSPDLQDEFDDRISHRSTEDTDNYDRFHSIARECFGL
jgi:hypothetical protein